MNHMDEQLQGSMFYNKDYVVHLHILTFYVLYMHVIDQDSARWDGAAILSYVLSYLSVQYAGVTEWSSVPV